MAAMRIQAILAALVAAMLPLVSSLSLDQSATSDRKWVFGDHKPRIEGARDLDLALQRTDLHHRFNARQKYLNCPILKTQGTHIIHTIYMPWNKTTQTLKPNEFDFDHTSYNNLVEETQGKWCVKLWTYSDMRNYVQAEYPGLWELVEKHADRPVALVDFYRLLVVYEFGGIFWQYGSTLTTSQLRLSDPFQGFMPPEGKSSRLLVEKWMTQEQADEMGRTRKSRNGKPSSLMRMATQVFGANPHDEFLRFACKRAVWNLLSIPVLRDFDILETMGNGMFSEAFADFQKLGKGKLVDVVPFEETQHMVRYSHTFSWRRDKGRCC